ncbi:hypothetical protein D3C77_709670 [compost metagenome]
MGTNWRPAAGDRVGCFAGNDSLWLMETVIKAHESFAICIKAVNLAVYRIESIMISAFTIFSFMINNGILYFYLARAQVALEVRHIVLGVP